MTAPAEARSHDLGPLVRLGEELAGHLGQHAEGTWLVGGVVRDALLGRDLVDVDLVTAGDPEAVARTLARGVGGTPFALSDRHGTWRIALDADRSQHLDVTALRAGDLAGDLAARDLTINAMAAPVLAPADIVDLHGGRDDLEERTIRMVAGRAFDDDPLRMLRAVRIAHRLDMEIDAETLAAIRARAARAAEPSGERTFHELQLLVSHPEARRGMRLLEQAGLEAVLLPELAACRGLEQSRFHHLDVADHTLAVLDNAEDILAATDFWLPLPASDGAPLDRAAWSEEQRLVVLFAAIAHDLGKPATHQLRANGSPSFVGHDEVGARIVDELCDRWAASNAFRGAVRKLVATHLALGFLLHGERDARAAHRFLGQVQGVAAEAIVLSVADRLATAGPDDRRRWVRAHLELARMLWAEYWRRERDGLPAPLLDGREIAAELGIEPGPKLGELVTVLAEEQAIGAVTTRDEALAALAAHLTAPTVAT